MIVKRHPLFYKLQTQHVGLMGSSLIEGALAALKPFLPQKQRSVAKFLGSVQKMSSSLKRTGRPFEGMVEVTSVARVFCGTPEVLREFLEEIYGEGIRVFAQTTGQASCFFGHFGVDKSHFVVARSIEDWAIQESFVVFAEDPGVFLANLRERVWSKDRTILLNFTKPPSSKVGRKEVPFTREIPRLPANQMMSARAQEIIQRTRHLSEGFQTRRNILLDGPPGVGKTTLLQQIIDAMGIRNVVHIQASNWKELEPFLPEIMMMEPHVLVFDDLDRLHLKGAGSALAFFEKFQGSIYATTNEVHQLPGALIRPGRIDEIFTIQTTDLDDLSQRLLEGMPEEVLQVLKDLPFTDVLEFHRRTRGVTEIPILLSEARDLVRVWEMRKTMSN